MKKIIIKFNKNLYSEAIQKFLFSNDIKWSSGDRNVDTSYIRSYKEEDYAFEVNLEKKNFSYGRANYFNAIDFTFPDDYSKIVDALTPKIEVGSYVKIVKDSYYEDGVSNFTGLKVGDIYQVEDFDKGGEYARRIYGDGNGCHISLLELVTKADYDAYIAAKTPNLTFGGVKVELVKSGTSTVYVETQGVTGTLDQIEAIVDELEGKNVRVFKFGSVELKKWSTTEFNHCIPNVLSPGEVVKEVTIGCTTGTLEELKAIIEAGNKLK